jgi:hypothetical protein
MFPVLLIVLLLVCTVDSCTKQSKKYNSTKDIVEKWIGKEIVFPTNFDNYLVCNDSLSIDCHTIFNKDYKILLYMDSTMCIPCQFKMFVWKKIIEEAKNQYSNTVSFLFFLQTTDIEQLKFLLRRDDLNYPVFIDSTNQINRLNEFPKKAEFQCFLLNRENKVLAIGNPVENAKIWQLYKEFINENK